MVEIEVEGAGAAPPDLAKLASMLDALQMQLTEMRAMLPAAEEQQMEVEDGEEEAEADEQTSMAPGADTSGELGKEKGKESGAMSRELLKRKMALL